MRQKLLAFPKERKHCFAWDIFGMPEIDTEVITYTLNVDYEFKLVKQNKKRRKLPPKEIRL